MIPIYKPYLPQEVLEYAHKAVDSTWISSQGEYLTRAEETLKELLNVSHVQLVNNGTAATHLVAKGLTYKHPKVKKIFVPNNVYVAAWNSFKYDDLVEMIPIDADIDTWNFDLDKLKEAVSNCDEKCAVLAVHNVGNIIDIPKLQSELPMGTVIVEDNCEGFMGSHGEHYAGTKSLLSSVSFFGNKNITSGEGGAIITNDDDLAEYVRVVQGQGQCKDKRYIHDRLGYNYRMTNIQAAILVGQLEHLSTIRERKEELFDYYRGEFEQLEGVKLQHIEQGTEHSNWMMGIRLVGNPSYEKAASYLKERGVDTRPMFYPMSYHTHLRAMKQYNEEVATLLSKECIIIPSYPNISKNEREHIAKSIVNYAQELRK